MLTIGSFGCYVSLSVLINNERQPKKNEKNN